MAKLNEGDVIEGIFTIALALYIAYGKVEKTELNRIRTQIDTKMFSTGRFKYTVVESLMKQRGKNPPDFFNVGFEMRLKPESIVGAYGKDYAVMYKSMKDVGNIDKKIDRLIEAINTASFSKRVVDAVDHFLNNNIGEIVHFNVIADGIAGESSGGALKGDVTLEVHATKKGGGTERVISGQLPFSLKSESVTVANLSPFNGMLDIAKAMDIKWDAEKKYSRLAKPFKGPVEQAAKFELIESMYSDLKKNIIIKSKSPAFSSNAYTFLEKSIFGSDLADVIDVTKGGVKEITKKYFDTLKKNVKLDVLAKGNNLVFIDSKTKTQIFQIRTKLRKEANEAKFYLEVGKGLYSK